MALHPELAAEQAYIDHAYECLEGARAAAERLRSMVEVGRGGTEQARFERDVIEETISQRLSQLDLGDAALVFGRIDRDAGERFYIGRLAVADEHQEPLVVDWRAPVAEPFYRATGRSPMGLSRRRHFATRGRTLLDIEDEVFGVDGATPDGDIVGQGALLTALDQARTGRLGDIVATIQAEQDEVIRGELPGVLVVQGGPGTGKTVVALHRAAYLLYTYRFPLEGQGVLVLGPNRLFLGYIERVLPSLGEAGVELAVLADLLPDVTVTGSDATPTARVKGDARMARVVAKAVRDRQRPLREDLVVGYGPTYLRCTVEQSSRIVAGARRRFRTHNAARRFVDAELFAALAGSTRASLDAREVRERLRGAPAVREALERMWPVLTPAELLHDLFGSHALLRLAAGDLLEAGEREALHRPRADDVATVAWTDADVPLLDEARALLGPRPRDRDDDLRTYGHIVVDEAQDLSPMQLRMIGRRSLNGSMTVVGDIAQATGAWAHPGWDDVVALLPDRRPARRRELTIGYRIPGQNMVLASRVLAVANPELRPPRSVREGGAPPRIVRAHPDRLGDVVAAMVVEERDAVGAGTVAVICASSQAAALSEALASAGVAHGRAGRAALDQQVTVVPVTLVKGLELDATVVVEPSTIVDEEAQGLRALYVALTRATKRLAVVHTGTLPDALSE